MESGKIQMAVTSKEHSSLPTNTGKNRRTTKKTPSKLFRKYFFLRKKISCHCLGEAGHQQY